MASFFPDPNDDAESHRLRPLSDDDIERFRAASRAQRIEEEEPPTSGDDESLFIDCMEFFADDLRARGCIGRRWPNGVLVYAFASDVTADHRDNFVEAAQEWSKVANVSFRERTNEKGYVLVQNDITNSATVGYRGKKQNLKIAQWDQRFVIVHEIGHSLGLDHEHCRDDRDTFVEILEENIWPGYGMNFEIREGETYSDYDFKSLMHYGPRDASKDGVSPTIQARPAYASQGKYMGNRTYISADDAVGMAARYGAPVTG